MPLTQAQFETAVDEFAPRLIKKLLHLTKGRNQDAEDLLQRTFIRAWEMRDKYEPELGSVYAWLMSLAQKLYLTYLRTQGRRQRLGNKFSASKEIEAGIQIEELAHPQRDPIQGRALRDCLRRLKHLNPKDAHIIHRSFAFPQTGTPESTDPSPGNLPQTDQELAQYLSNISDETWSKNRIKQRRFIALKQVRACLEKKHLAAQNTQARSQETNMGEENNMPGIQALTDRQLLELLEDPEAAHLSESLKNLPTCEYSRTRLGAFLALEAALFDDHLRSHFDTEQGTQAIDPTEDVEPSLRPGLRKKLRAIPVRTTGLSLVKPTANGHIPPQFKGWFAPIILVAALLFVAVGGRQIQEMMSSSNSDPAWVQLKGKLPTENAIPLRLIVKNVVDSDTIDANIEKKSPELFVTSTNTNNVIQLRVLRPVHITPNTSESDGQEIWTVSADFSIQKANGKSIKFPEASRTAVAQSTDPDVKVGPSIHLQAMGKYNLLPGDKLVFEIKRGQESMTLQVILLP